MSSAILEDFVVESQVEAKKKEKRQRRKRPNLSQDAPQNTRFPIPEECKGYALPEDINRFITLIYPNIHCYVSAYVPPGPQQKGIIHDTIQGFIVYMLSPAPTRNNVPHWTLYNPEYNEGRMPYYKYFNAQLIWFLKGVKRDAFKHTKDHVSLSEGSYEATSDKENRAFNPDSLQESEIDRLPESNWSKDVTDNIFLTQVRNFLFSVSKNAVRQDGFEVSAYLFFELKLEGASNVEIAKAMDIPLPQVKVWSKELKALMESFFEEEPCEVLYIPAVPEEMPKDPISLDNDFFERAMERAIARST